MRKLYWYITAYIKKHGLTFILALIGAVLIFSVLMPALAKKISIKKRHYLGIIGEYTLQSLPLEIKNQLSVGLTKVDPTNQSIKPLLAERWITENEGKTYRFIIKKNVVWQDGTPLVPDDINYNFNDVETITTASDIIFKLPATFIPFPAVVREPIFKQATQKYLLFFKKPTLIGIGPYKINSYKEKSGRLQEIILDSPEDRLIYRFYLTENNAILGFKKGEVDIIKDVRQPQDLKDWSDQNIVLSEKINYDEYLAVFFNNSHPLFSKGIRQAFSYAIKKPDGDIRAISPINPSSWAYLEGGKDYDQDIERATERLLNNLPAEPMDIDLTTTSIYQDEANDLKQQWETFGQQAAEACATSDVVENKNLCPNAAITIHIKVSNFPDTSNFELLLLGQKIPVDPDQYFLWHSDQSTNFTRYQNTRIDSLLESGRQTLEQKERVIIYQEFQQFLLEDPPALFLKYLTSYDISRK